MNLRLHTIGCVVGVLLLAAQFPRAQGAAPASSPATLPATSPALSPAEIQKLIEQLGNNNFRIRDAAQKKLIDAGEGAKAEVELALKSDDLETRQRAKLILEEIQRTIREQATKRLLSAFVWNFPTSPGLTGSPTVIKGVTYVVNAKERKLYAVDCKTGKELWTFDELEGGSTTYRLLTGDGAILIADSTNTVQAVDLQSHKVAWKAEAPVAEGNPVDTTVPAKPAIINNARYAAPLVTSGVLAVPGLRGAGLFGYDLKTGKRLWKDSQTPLLMAANGDEIFCVALDGMGYVLDAKTGKKSDLGKEQLFELNELSKLSGVILRDHVAIVRTAGTVQAFDTKAGKKLWSYDLPALEANSLDALAERYASLTIISRGVVVDNHGMDIADGAAWILQGTELIALDVATGKKKAQHTLSLLEEDADNPKSKMVLSSTLRQNMMVTGPSTLVIDGGRAYIRYYNGVHAVELSSGNLLWSLPMVFPVTGRVVLADGVAYFNTTMQYRAPPAGDIDEKSPLLILGLHAIRVTEKDRK